MKKSLALLASVILLIILISLFSIIKAEELTNVQEDLKSAGTDISQEGKQLLEREIKIPDNIQIITRILFGLQGQGGIDFSEFIVLIAVWIMIFLIIHSILQVVPLFGGWKAIVGGIVITCIIAISEAIKYIAMFFFNLGNFFSILARWSILKLLFALIIIAILTFGLKIILKILKNKAIIEQAEEKGIEAAAGAARLEAMEKMSKKLK